MSGREKSKQYRQKHDPYNALEQNYNFLSPKNHATTKLKDFENSALKRSHPNPNTSTFTNSVSGKKRPSKSIHTPKSRFLHFAKKKLTPATFILLVLFGLFFAFFGAESLLGFHLTQLFPDPQFASRHKSVLRIYKRDLKLAKVPNSAQKQLAKHKIKVKQNKLIFKNEVIDAKNIDYKFTHDRAFATAFSKANYGKAAGQFDNSATKHYKLFGSVRKLFANTKADFDAKTSRTAFNQTISRQSDGVSGRIATASKKEDGDEVVKNGEDLQVDNIEGDSPEAKARSFVNGVAEKTSMKGNIACAALQTANLISIAAAANQSLKAIEFFLVTMEPISRTMDGDQSPHFNDALNSMTETTDSKVDYIDENGRNQTKVLTGSMLEASPMKTILSSTPIDRNETQLFSPSIFSRSIIAAIATHGLTTTACSAIRASSAIISLASNGVPGGKLATLVIGLLVKSTARVAMAGSLALILSTIIPRVAKTFFTPTYKAFTGIAAGNLFAFGGFQNNNRLAQNSSAYMPTTKERLRKVNQNYQESLALEASIERAERSPFDPSSPNTFIGSLIHNFNTQPLHSFASLKSSFSNSLNRILPTAFALEGTDSYLSNTFECEDLPGTVCDGFGTNFTATDFSTLDHINEAKYQAVLAPNLNPDGSIKDDSNLAKFINFCVHRESPWGVTDANILSALQTGGIVANSIPIVDDVVDLINLTEDLANKKWATGENCINSSTNPYWDSEFAYYQRYIEDERTKSSIDQDSQNEALAYRERYEQNHPLNNSYNGLIARYSGLSQNQVAYTLSVLKHADILANYQKQLAHNQILTFSALKPIKPSLKPHTHPNPSVFAIILNLPIQPLQKRNQIL